LTSGQLAAGGTQTMRPAGTLVPQSLSGAAVDANGTLWLVDGVTVGAFDGYTTASLQAAATSGTLGAPAIVDALPYPTVFAAAGAAFDASGNLWIATMETNNHLYGFTPAQLASGGTLTPTYSVSVTTDLFVKGMAFDAQGTLWMLNQLGLPTSLLGFTAAQLAAGGSQSPAVTLGMRESFPRGMAFDASGNLWVAYFSQSEIVKFTPSQLAAGGIPAPDVTLDVTNPAGLAFDAGGDLWVALQTSNEVVEYPSSQLIGSGIPTAAVTIPVHGPAASQPTYLVFDPHPGNVPLSGSRVVSRPNANVPATTRRHR
jgi:hypothetical protein